MQAGSRNRKVTFERFTSTKDGYGHEQKTWATYCTEWAAVSFGTGMERRDAAQKAGEAPATFQILANGTTNGLTVLDRITLDGAVWDISSIAPSREFNAGLDITATRATS